LEARKQKDINRKVKIDYLSLTTLVIIIIKYQRLWQNMCVILLSGKVDNTYEWFAIQAWSG
jgi:hypothetical protein